MHVSAHPDTHTHAQSRRPCVASRSARLEPVDSAATHRGPLGAESRAPVSWAQPAGEGGQPGSGYPRRVADVSHVAQSENPALGLAGGHCLEKTG